VNTDSINKTPSQLPPADDDPSSKSPVENSSTGGGTPPNIEDPRSPNGTFPPGISGNPRGRPRGSLNRYSRSQAALLARTLLEERTADITQKIIEAAMTGNILALKLCADRLFPAPQDVPIPFTIPKPGSPPNDVLEAHSALIHALAAGEVSPQEAQIISNVLEAHRRSWEGTAVLERLEEIERRLNKNKK